jgi:hypothetical protein
LKSTDSVTCANVMNCNSRQNAKRMFLFIVIGLVIDVKCLLFVCVHEAVKHGAIFVPCNLIDWSI